MVLHNLLHSDSSSFFSNSASNSIEQVTIGSLETPTGISRPTDILEFCPLCEPEGLEQQNIQVFIPNITTPRSLITTNKLSDLEDQNWLLEPVDHVILVDNSPACSEKTNCTASEVEGES